MLGRATRRSFLSWDGVNPGVQQLFQPGCSVATVTKMMQQAMDGWRRQQPAQVKAFQQRKLLS